MSSITNEPKGRRQARTVVAAERAIVIGALGAAAFLGRTLPVAAAPLPQHPCTPQLERLLADWNAAGFEMPTKPTQAVVHSRSGRVSSGPEVTYMTAQIRQAIWDCQHGDVPAVRARVALVTERLHPRS